MLNQPEPACLVIADISGYTGFLAGAELDHAQDILAALMSTVVGAFRPGFKLAKLLGRGCTSKLNFGPPGPSSMVSSGRRSVSSATWAAP